MTLSLPLTANADGNESATATIRFVSAPRAINNPITFVKELAYSEAVANAEILASGASGLSLWHHNAGFAYMLVGADSEDFVEDTGGKIAIGNNRLEGDRRYEFRLELRGGVTATLSIQVNVAAEPVVPIASRAAFVEAIEEGDFNWFSAKTDMITIVEGGTTLDWDNDGIANPYDWTPLPGVTLTLGGADGSASKPWPIYNVWQLQAIDGLSVSHDGTDRVKQFTLFGGDSDARLGAQYRLAVDIDATPTRVWGNAGFNPIGGSSGTSNVFNGFFDGGGYAVRGLFINRPTGKNIGLFSRIIKSGELAVSNLGVEEANISGGTNVGIFVGLAEASFSRVWTTGNVKSNETETDGNGDNVGGLVGFFEVSASAGSASNTVMMSWSTADVEGVENFVGGLIGYSEARAGSIVSDDNWAAGNVSGDAKVGGGAGVAGSVTFTRNWSSGAVSGEQQSRGGFVGDVLSEGVGGNYVSVYWNLDTSGVTISEGDSVNGSVVVQTLTVSNFGDEAAAAAWDFGDSDISDGVADFPLLTIHSRPWQAVNLARALTRILGISDAATITAAAGITITTNKIRLDTNGLAADTGSGGTSTPSCSFDSGVLRAQTNYNGVTVELSLLTDGTQALAAIDMTATENCEIGFTNAGSEFGATLRLEISAPATVIDSTRTDPARALTVDYVLRIAPPSDDSSSARLMIEAPQEPIRVAADASDGAAVFTVSVSGGTNPSFDSANSEDFGTNGGDGSAAVTLARDSPTAFSMDKLEISLILTAHHEGGSETATATILFVSAPRAFDKEELQINLSLDETEEGDVVLAGGASELSIWHNDNNSETYSIESAGDNFGVDSTTGNVAVVALRGLSAGVYSVTLRLRGGGLQATRGLRINVEATPQEAAREAFVESIAADDFNWFANTLDWDEDGVANPYDWTPTVNGDGMTINLTLGADGSAENPWPIYNVWQLQAIADVSVAMNGTLSEGLALFGDGDNLTAHYRLAADIDATPTRGWNDGNGFNPIGIKQLGTDQPDAIEFKGSLDGKGRVIRGLYANLNVDGGLFYSIGTGGRVSRLGLPDVEIRGHGVNNTNERNTGALAHLLSGKVSLVWATGEVVADDGKGRVGGLVRSVGNTDEGTSGEMRESWFVGKVRGETSVGGLVGFGDKGIVADSWAMARVEWSETRRRQYRRSGWIWFFGFHFGSELVRRLA